MSTKKREEEPRVKLEKTDYDALSPLLDFYSDRAVAHASFLVACIFGLVSLLSLLKGANLTLKIGYSIPYLILLGGGYYSLLNFGHFANEAENIKRTIEDNKKLLLNEIKEGTPKRIGKIGKIYSVIRFPYSFIKKSENKLILMVISYLIVGILAWLFTFVQ